MQPVIDELKTFFRSNGVPVFGIAEAKQLENEPAGRRPSDLLPSATSMLSFAIPYPKGLFSDKKRLNSNYWRMASIYYQKLDAIAAQAALIVESHSGAAAPVLS